MAVPTILSFLMKKQIFSMVIFIEIADPEFWAQSRKTETCWKWWEYVADIMETNPDTSPVSIPLSEIFHLD